MTTPKLVATDLDGTLLRSDGALSQRSRAALSAAGRAGMPVVLVTGRPPRSVPGLLERIGHHAVIAANGATVHFPDGAIARTSPSGFTRPCDSRSGCARPSRA